MAKLLICELVSELSLTELVHMSALHNFYLNYFQLLPPDVDR